MREKEYLPSIGSVLGAAFDSLKMVIVATTIKTKRRDLFLLDHHP